MTLLHVTLQENTDVIASIANLIVESFVGKLL